MTKDEEKNLLDRGIIFLEKDLKELKLWEEYLTKLDEDLGFIFEDFLTEDFGAIQENGIFNLKMSILPEILNSPNSHRLDFTFFLGGVAHLAEPSSLESGSFDQVPIIKKIRDDNFRIRLQNGLFFMKWNEAKELISLHVDWHRQYSLVPEFE